MVRNGDKQSGKLSSLEPKTGRVKALERVSRARSLLRPATISWVLNILVGVAVVFIISHPRANPVHEAYTRPEREGEPVIAIRDFKIPRDLEVPDQEGTNKKRAEAETRVLSLYDWDPTVRDAIKANITALFEGFRELYPPAPEEPAVPGSQPITVPKAFLAEKEQEILRAFGTPIEAEQVERLKARKFSPELESAALGLVDAVYKDESGADRFIVPSKDLLLKDRDKGILAQRINSPPDEAPREIKNFDPIRDISSSQEIIDQAAKEKLGKLPSDMSEILVTIVKSQLDPNLTFNKKKTEEAKAEAVAAVKPLYFKYKKDEVIVRKGDRLSPETIKKVDAIRAALETRVPRSFRSAGTMFLVIFFLATVVVFSNRNIKKWKLNTKDKVFLVLVLLSSLGLLRGMDFLSRALQNSLTNVPEGINLYYLIPLAGAVMLVRMVLNSEMAFIFAAVLAGLGAMVADDSLLFMVYSLVGSVMAASEVGQCRQRSAIIRAGLLLGIVNVLMILIISMITNNFLDMETFLPSTSLLWNGFFGLMGGVLAAIVVTGLVPLVESLFSYATDIKLLELLNQDHPLLKELSMRAPGTQQHSLMVANLAEEAAKAIGANPLLARVCAMYHDLGKMNKPLYFAENQWDGNNVHERLSPSMSTLIIHSHVKEGMEMAQKHKLPQVVIDCIQQHHGNSLLAFFYEKAKELDSSGVPVEERDYRYPAPKPQSREAAIIMLADVVESASRTVRDPNPARLKGMVQKLINRFFTDGQFDECDLTLKNLHDIARSFNTTLGAIYHHRPDYPQPVVKGQAQEKKKKAEQDAAGSKDKAQNKSQDEQEKDKEQNENYLKRLGM